ncbi:MAG: type 1 glutamine amidotransferase domain-containing protein [Akkermansiaceae bacterium]|nr:type 1 glutamine amidotransferase domain-containing protein [Akkermansiaceae bacterium]
MKRILFTLLSLCGLATAAPQPIVLVLTNVDHMRSMEGESEATPTGFYLSEAAHPYAVFTDAGHEVILASPDGGFAPVDPKSLKLEKDKKNQAFWEAHGDKLDGRAGVEGTKPLSSIDPKDVAGVYFAGGHGTMWDFPNSKVVGEFITRVDANQGVIGAVCHGPAAFIGAKGADGKPLVAGKKVAAFTNAEEKAVKLEEVVPFLLESELEKAGAEVVTAANWAENAVRDGRLVTGQNPSSATKSAKLFVEALKDSE